MKPDGTYTVDEILQMCNDQLQSWERQELAEKLGTDFIYSAIRDMDADELADISGYYVSDDEPEEKEVEDFFLSEIVDGLIFKLSYIMLRPEERDRLLKAIEDNKE